MKRIKKLNAFSNKCERGWFLGHFSKIEELQTNKVEAQFVILKTGQKKDGVSYQKTGKTLSMLLSGKIKISFPEDKKTVTLEKEGDFVIFAEKVPHSWECLKKAKVITIRWPSRKNDIVKI